MAQLLERKGISGSSLCPLATESGFPVICLNSKESNLRKLLKKQKEQEWVASIFDNLEIVSYLKNSGIVVFEGFASLRSGLVLLRTYLISHTVQYLAAAQALMSYYSKALRERRFPQDVAAPAYVLLCVCSLYTLHAFPKLLFFVEIQELVDLVYSLFICLLNCCLYHPHKCIFICMSNKVSTESSAIILTRIHNFACKQILETEEATRMKNNTIPP